MTQKLRIVSRNSRLALWQANFVRELLVQYYPKLDIEIIGVTTQGDLRLEQSLAKIGGKGLFIKELEVALLEDRADIAVHSLKDLPVTLPAEFKLAAILKREDPRDVLIANDYDSLASMPKKAIIGTSSARRVVLLKHYYPHLEIKLLRGNLDTRLTKLNALEYDGIILAAAGVKRLGLEHLVREYLAVDQFVPAIGQGALAIEVLNKRSDLARLLQPVNDELTAKEVGFEREVGMRLGANCGVPLGVYVECSKNEAIIKAMLANEDAKFIMVAKTASIDDLSTHVNLVVSALQDLGADAILKDYKS